VAAAAITLWLVIPTLMPGVGSWDTAEFQTVGPVLGTAHPTGFPSYVITGWIVSHLLPFGDPAYRMNLLQAILAAVAVAGTVAVVQILTGRRWIALATGLLLAWTKLFWSLAVHADPHMFHLALVTVVFVLLLAWEKRRISAETSSTTYVEGRWLLAAGALYGVAVAALGLRLLLPVQANLVLAGLFFALVLASEAVARDRARATAKGPGSRSPGAADRWLVAAAFVYGAAVANHGLALLLPPAIGLFVLAVEPRVMLRWRTVAACALVLVATVVVLYLELPIRAAMKAPLVYGHPDTWSGFTYVALGQQFEGSLVDPLGNLVPKAAAAIDLLAGWLGPLGYLAVLGLATSLIRRPRYVLLSGVAAITTCIFAQSYTNAVIERYYLVPLFVVFTWAGLAAADLVALAAWLAARVGGVLPGDARWHRLAALGLEILAAAALLVSMVGIVPARQHVRSDLYPEGVSEADQTGWASWLHEVLAPASQGGLPKDSVIVSWWSYSTILWYGQRVEGIRPDITIIDDSDRMNDNLGDVWDVYDHYLGKRPVFTIRLPWGADGTDALKTMFDIEPYALPNGNQIDQVIGRLEGSP
jgi:hypothetical protein